MRFKTTLHWSLIGYLVLFLNLGPSLHRAHFFGLHCDSGVCGDSIACLEETDSESKVPLIGVGSTSCCGTAHRLINCSGGSPTDHAVPEGSPGHLVITTDHDCPVCRFFDTYNVVVDQFELPTDIAPVFSLAFELRSCEISKVILLQSRGPPQLDA